MNNHANIQEFGKNYANENKQFIYQVGMDADEFAEAALENYQSNADASGTLPLSSDKHEDFVFGAKQAFPL